MLAAVGAAVGLAYTARTYRLSREGQLTDRYTKAVEQLGSDKIEVRLGGLYALERLMHDSPADRPTIIEVLAAYIRQHAQLGSPAPIALATTAPLPSSRLRIAGLRRSTRLVLPDRPDADVQAALTVLGRRTPIANENAIVLTDTRLGGVGLVRADLSKAWLDGTDLSGAWLDGTDLSGAGLTGVDLSGARVTRGALTPAQLASATNAHLISWAEPALPSN